MNSGFSDLINATQTSSSVNIDKYITTTRRKSILQTYTVKIYIYFYTKCWYKTTKKESERETEE